MTFHDSDTQALEEDLRPWKELPEIEEPAKVETKVLDLETAKYIEDLMELMRRRR